MYTKHQYIARCRLSHHSGSHIPSCLIYYRYVLYIVTTSLQLAVECGRVCRCLYRCCILLLLPVVMLQHFLTFCLFRGNERVAVTDTSLEMLLLFAAIHWFNFCLNTEFHIVRRYSNLSLVC